MSKGFHFIQLPNFIMPRTLPSESELQGMVRPLNYCPNCHYVLCSCGNCHNTEQCNENCLKPQQGGDTDG